MTNTPKKIISDVINLSGSLDILVNNAGIMKENTVEETSLEEWNEHITVNLTAPFLLIKYSIPFLKKTNGSIINIGSIHTCSIKIHGHISIFI